MGSDVLGWLGTQLQSYHPGGIPRAGDNLQQRQLLNKRCGATILNGEPAGHDNDSDYKGRLFCQKRMNLCKQKTPPPSPCFKKKLYCKFFSENL